MANERIIDFRVRRTKEGMELKVTSEKIEEFFSGLSNKTKKGIVMANQQEEIDMYNVSNPPVVPGATFNNPNAPFIDANNNVNLMVLMAKGLKDGVTITFRETHSRSALQTAGETIKHSIQQLYQEYMEPIEVSVTVEEEG